MSRSSTADEKKVSWVDLCEQEVSVAIINVDTDSDSEDCVKPPQKVSLPEKVQQESSVCENQRNMDRLLKQVEGLKKILKASTNSLKKEKVRRAKAESDCVFYKREITDLKQGLDYYQHKVETHEKTVQTLQNQLQSKENLCESLQKRSKQESLLRHNLAQEKQKSDNEHIINNKLQKEIAELHKEKENLLNKLENFSSMKKEADEKMSAQLETLKHQLEEKSSLCHQLESSFIKEKQLRVQLQQEKKNQKKDLSHQKLKNEIWELEQGLDYYQNNAETREKRMKSLQIELQNKETACEDLQKTLKQLRVQLAQEQQNSQSKDTITENLKEEVGELKKSLVQALESLNSTKIEVKEKMSQQLEVFNQQLEEKSALCQTLKSSLDKEQQLRVSCQAELDNTRVLVSENSDLQQEIQDLKERNSELRDVMITHVSEKVESDQQFVQQLQKLKEQHEEELVTLKLQLKEHLRSEIQPGSEIYSPEPQPSVESLETNPDKDCQTDVCQTEIVQETLELSQSLHSNESPSEEAVPQTVKPQQNISKWRRFKKFMTPACLRKHKNKL
ncbi:putative leucine-rich repeat-containing protein DDB_G0290503 [Nothobranchius furzeri]|uniref:putative leucine-rich repeat-containing protein DDB_G0290503 n=1 Tax=Nothobranchius furzeri TaxID=105023 RepID=UPI00390477A2